MTDADQVPDAARVRLMSRPGCHLCETARAALERVVRDAAPEERVHEIDITQHPELMQRYSHEVPVVVIDGQPICVFTVDAKKVRSALRHGPAGRRRWWRA
ncbi:glutaredoxin family protein [Micrococcales bacterium 31B]|nr:glutaredoxin family protein [Micrococcales bacterium 31B]